MKLEIVPSGFQLTFFGTSPKSDIREKHQLF
jgi:hypothetical protein